MPGKPPAAGAVWPSPSDIVAKAWDGYVGKIEFLPDPVNIQFIGDMQRLELKPGDVLVLKCPGKVSYDTAEKLRDMIETRFPGHKTLVLGDGLELGVIAAPSESET